MTSRDLSRPAGRQNRRSKTAGSHRGRKPFRRLEISEYRSQISRRPEEGAGAPHLPAFFSGKFAKGHPEISSGLSFLKSSTRDAGVNPFRVLAAYMSFDPS